MKPFYIFIGALIIIAIAVVAWHYLSRLNIRGRDFPPVRNRVAPYIDLYSMDGAELRSNIKLPEEAGRRLVIGHHFDDKPALHQKDDIKIDVEGFFSADELRNIPRYGICVKLTSQGYKIFANIGKAYPDGTIAYLNGEKISSSSGGILKNDSRVRIGTVDKKLVIVPHNVSAGPVNTGEDETRGTIYQTAETNDIKSVKPGNTRFFKTT